jgi:hypothetical protein
MMNSHDSEVWSHLYADPPHGDAFVARVAFPEISEVMLAAIDSYGNRHFLIPLSLSDEPLIDRSTRGLTVTSREMVVNNGTAGIVYIDIECNDPAGHEGFDIVGRQIAELLKTEGLSRSEAVSRILARWRYFWGRLPKNVLNKEEIIGLFAELWFLRYWLLPYSETVSALRSWNGPHGARHDFEMPRVSVEVKGTVSVRGRRHWINGIDQLSPPMSGQLFLFSLKIREEGGAIITLPELVKSITQYISEEPDAMEIFENSLSLTGYSPVHEDEYGKMHFRVVDQLLFEVRDTFPRLTADTLHGGIPHGIETIEYEINLDGYDNLIISDKPGMFSDW